MEKNKMLFELRVSDLVEIISSALSDAAVDKPSVVHEQACGMNDLAAKIGCSVSTVYKLRKEGVLDDAEVSHIGRNIYFDVSKARALADEYQKGRRKQSGIVGENL